MTALDRPKRQRKTVTRLINEYPKYTKGKYHGWKDTYDRKYNGHNNYKTIKSNKTSIHELPFPI